MTNVARHVISKFGGGDFAAGVQIVSKVLDLHKTRVYRMTYPKDRGGTGGLIPAEHQPRLLDAAPGLNIQLTPDDFFETGLQTTP